jgi:eukaryotic-like serine/threonine-protein kinase
MITPNLAAADWNEIAATVADALDCATESERLALVEARCAGRSAMQSEVMSLIRHAADAKQLIASGGAPQHAALSTSKILQTLAGGSIPSIGSRLNAWKILGELGRGGMGIVFHVEREIDAPSGVSARLQTRQEGALKLMRLDASNEQALARFAREQKILAQLNHPNIARLIDGGATLEGNPYLVMEYAAGQSLDQWCATTQPSLETRLHVMQKVCAAVQYAHQLLVVHRDLKPSNIIIQADGTPKLLDFGIAKLLSDDANSDHTSEAAQVYTPWYASPEHLRGEVVSTTSDVYSLGVILYGLLTAKRPYKLRNTTTTTPVDVMHAVLETEATQPSSANAGTGIEAAWGGDDKAVAIFANALKGDLDNIILKALAKEPARRYATPEALAADLQRYLNHEPVTAGSPTTYYRATKFIRRNRLGVAAATFAASALMVGAGMAIWQGLEAIKQRNIAEQRFNDSREQATTVLFDYLDAVQYLPGSTPIRKRMAEDAQKYLDKLNLSTEVNGDSKTAIATNAAILTSVATALHRLSFVQYNGFFRPHLDEREAATKNATRALGIYEKLIAAGVDTEEMRFEYGQALSQMGGLSNGLANWDKARTYFEQCIAVYTDAAKRDRADLRNGIELARCNLRLANALNRLYPYPLPTLDALFSKHLQQARNALDAVAAAQPKHAELAHVWEWVWRLEGQQKQARGDWPGALKLNLEILEIMQALLLKEPLNSAYQTDMGSTYREIAAIHNAAGNYAHALAAADKGIQMLAVVVKNDPTVKQSTLSLARAMHMRAWALIELAKAGDKNAKDQASAAITDAKTTLAPLAKLNANDATVNAMLVDIAYREADFVALKSATSALALAQATLIRARALDTPTASIAAAVRVALLQNQISVLALNSNNRALSQASDAELKLTLARIQNNGVLPPVLRNVNARVQS